MEVRWQRNRLDIKIEKEKEVRGGRDSNMKEKRDRKELQWDKKRQIELSIYIDSSM